MLRCANNHGVFSLTTDKIYKVIEFDGADCTVKVVNDEGKEAWYKEDMFKPIKVVASHYGDDIQPFDLMRAKGTLQDFCKDNLIKYSFRQGKKVGQEQNDLIKILDYAMLLCMEAGADQERMRKVISKRFNR
ncbi:MAG: DUF3310 domain-containing protein [Cetobacterium sp.]